MVSVFKTNVSDKKVIKTIKPLLDNLMPDSRWNFDLKDCDKILRIDSLDANSAKIIETLNSMGFECIELV